MKEQKMALTEVGTNEVEIMRFYLDVKQGKSVYRAYYGVNVAKVLKIMRMPESFMKPPERAHPSVLGAFHFKDRDMVVPLVGLAKYLESERVEQEEPKVIVTEFNEVTTAFLVSGVTRIYRLSWKDVEQPDRLVNAYSHNAFTGVVRLDEQVVFILDLEKIVIELNPRAASMLYGHGAVDIKADRPVSILHVDDQVVVRKLVKRALERNPMFTVHSANGGAEALDWLLQKKGEAEAGGVPIGSLVDVVVTDVEMPVMDGYTMCRKIKEDPVLKQLPVFLFSSLVTKETMHKGTSVGADGQFPKPQTEAMATEMMVELARRCLQRESV
ncbi:MAG: chemotaxis protein CheV [Desulfovibrionaceae bacterium]